MTDDRANTKNQYYDAALAMYAREHDRWNQWALFFFGAIGAVYYVAGHLTIPAYIPSATACLVSVVWVCVASTIRATTVCWRNTMLEFEAHPELTEGAFQVFTRHLAGYRRLADLAQTLKLWTGEPWTSVTRLLVLAGVFAFVAFLAITIMSAMGCISAATGQA